MCWNAPSDHKPCTVKCIIHCNHSAKEHKPDIAKNGVVTSLYCSQREIWQLKITRLPLGYNAGHNTVLKVAKREVDHLIWLIKCTFCGLREAADSCNLITVTLSFSLVSVQRSITQTNEMQANVNAWLYSVTEVSLVPLSWFISWYTSMVVLDSSIPRLLYMFSEKSLLGVLWV